MVVRSSRSNLTQIAAAVIGNALEWYDFVIFGFFTVVIARVFFPGETQYASLLLSTAVFGVGFFMRPVGGILLGIYADRNGRKAAMVMIIALMTIGIALIAFAPTYAAIGIASPMLIVLARLLQGFATGGEFASATAFLIESAPANRRGLYGSWQMVGQGLAVLIGALLSALVTKNLSQQALDSWGWRIPFIFGLLIGPVGVYIRRRAAETPAFLSAVSGSRRPPLSRLFANHLLSILVCMGIVTNGSIGFYIVLLYTPTFANTQLGIPLASAFLAQSLGLALFVFLVPCFGWLSDRVGRRVVLIPALACYLAVAYPLFAWIHASPTATNLILMQIALCGLLAAFFGPMSTALAEQFPPAVRSSGLAISYNIAVMIFGGFAQFFVTWLIGITESPIAPVFYLMFGALTALLSAFFLMEHARERRSMPRLPPHLRAWTR